MTQIHHQPSPNFNDRKRALSMLVLHYTGMENAEVAIERLCDPAAQVSAHYVVKEDGTILQLVDEDKRAWHAGVSCWRGERDVNSASIGVEIVNRGHDFDLPDFPEAQIQAVIALCQGILTRHDIHALDVIGHSDIAPDRKTDPGEKFPWPRLAQAGIGYWPTPREAGSSDVTALLAAIGYDVPDPDDLTSLIRAVQRRYTPDDLSGVAGPRLLALMRDLAGQSASRA